MKDKNMWLFLFKRINFLSFFSEIILINQTGIFFMKNAVVFNRKKFAQLDALSCIVLFRIVSVDIIIVQFLYRDIEHTQNETKGKHRYT